MEQLNHDCPRCGTKAAGFRLMLPGVRFGIAGSWDAYDVLAKCGVCGRSSVFSLSSPRDLKNSNSEDVQVMGVAPAPVSIGAPPHTPSNVARYYEQAMENLPRNWDAAGAMFRKVLDTGLKAKWPDVKGGLANRIRKVADSGGLTPDMRAWADHIRLEGNDATHDEDPFEENQAAALATFTELFLMYAFQLPGMIGQARETNPEGGDGPE